MWPKQAGGLFEQRVGTAMGDTALSGVVGVGVWVTLITPKVNTCICVTHNKRVHTVTSEEVREKVRLIKIFHT